MFSPARGVWLGPDRASLLPAAPARCPPNCRLQFPSSLPEVEPRVRAPGSGYSGEAGSLQTRDPGPPGCGCPHQPRASRELRGRGSSRSLAPWRLVALPLASCPAVPASFPCLQKRGGRSTSLSAEQRTKPNTQCSSAYFTAIVTTKYRHKAFFSFEAQRNLCRCDHSPACLV